MRPKPCLCPIDVLITALAGWLCRRQNAVLEYLREENRVLRKRIGTRRIRFTDGERRRLAAKGFAIGRRLLAEFATLVTPETILAWHRKLIAKKWTHRPRMAGRRRTAKEIADLILRIVAANPTWGYRRIQGALANIGHTICANTVRRVLKDNGIEPAPTRPTSWKTFLRSHAAVIAAADFFTTEVWTARGLVTHYTLFAIDHATRAVEILGTTTNPTTEFMKQVARNVTDATTGFLRTKRYLIIDRDSIFCAAFRDILRAARVEPTRIRPSSPNCNAIAERFVRSVKSECIERLIFFGTASLERALAEFSAHYNAERNHQGVENRLIAPATAVGAAIGRIRTKERLGGLLNYYHRVA